jgi:hypothetical protein
MEKQRLRSRKPRLTAVVIRYADHATPSSRKTLAPISPTSGGRSVGIVRLRTKTMEFVFCLTNIYVFSILCCTDCVLLLQHCHTSWNRATNLPPPPPLKNLSVNRLMLIYILYVLTKWLFIHFRNMTGPSDWIQLFNGPKLVGISRPFTWPRKQIKFPEHWVLCFLECRMMDKVQKLGNSECSVSVNHNPQNHHFLKF